MPTQANIVQTVGTVAWDGTTAYAADIRKWVRFGWTFEVTADITADTTFTVEAAPVSEDDNCTPGDWEAVPEVWICDKAVPGSDGNGNAALVIPEGTPAGSICSGTIACRPGAFIRLVAAGGQTANVKAVLLRQGPMM